MSFAGKYLTFGLGGEEFALPVLKVREIIKVMNITTVPQMPAHVLGVINLRGKVVPVIDLRLKFEVEAQAFTERTCIIVVEVATADTRVSMGVIVDSVSEVITLAGDEVDTPPAMGDSTASAYLVGIAKVKGTVKMLLDLDGVLAADRFDHAA